MNLHDEQIALFRLGYEPGPFDGIDGPRTRDARDAFLADVGACLADYDAELARSAALLPLFIQAKSYTRTLGDTREIRRIVIHTIEGVRREGTARSTARWFAGELAPTFPSPAASAHYCIDDQETIACVLDCHMAWHAPGANEDGIGIEHAGFAAMTREQWRDGYSSAVLLRSASLVRGLCDRWKIPIARIGADELRAGAGGICGHFDCTVAFSHGRGHTDPGEGFPWSDYLDLVQTAR